MDQSLIDALNRILSQEHACAVRYATHAAVVSGPYSESVSARLKEIASDELLHAEWLRERIVALGGKPTMAVRAEDLREATTLEEILRVNIAEETEAIQAYAAILEKVPRGNVILYRTIEDIIRDEQEHLEELEDLQEAR